MEYNGFDIEWTGQSSLKISDKGFTVAVDPVNSPDYKADIVIFTGSEDDFRPDKIDLVCNERTCVVIPESMDEGVIPCKDVEVLSEGDHINIFGVDIEALPMYGEEFERGQALSYRFVMRDESFYVAGVSGLMDEFFELENRVDVAFLPVDGEDKMDVDDAVKAAVRIKPDMVVPYMYGEKGDRELDLKAFQAELEDRSIGCRITELNQ